jgi:hypothetical protein
MVGTRGQRSLARIAVEARRMGELEPDADQAEFEAN